ncbi:MAG: sugar phosphate nucleotidyltransferase [Gammaproteobacteria bacterium]|nr:sugar phosphate nucleotidyltransferase [Gammaproteobacteria bacterium]
MKSNLFPVVILAGGLATRLRPVTEKIPKSLLSVKGQPFIFHQLKLLQQQGVRKVVLCVGFLAEKIQQYVGDGKAFGLSVEYSYDGDMLLGTAGAIQNALPLLDDHFFVLYGDSYLTCPYAAVQESFIQQQKMALMTVFRNDGQWDKSNVVFRNHEILNYSKAQQTIDMHHIDYGLGVFNQRVFSTVSHYPYDLATVYQHCLEQHQLAAFEVTERFYEVGSFSGIEELEAYLV